jgi:phosphate transport system substrate-binding protein
MRAYRKECRHRTPWFVLKTVVLSAVLAAFPLLALPPNAHSSDTYLTASGCSVSNTGYLTALAREYERRTGVKIFVRGGGSVVGLGDLRSGKVDFAASCMPKKATDSPDISSVQVAWDALAFIVHKSNSAESISLDEVRAIYAGKITDWGQITGTRSPIKVFISRTRRGLSGVEAFTKKLVLNGAEPADTPNTFFVASSGIVEQMVEQTPEGFATTGITSARKRDVKILKLDGVAPTNKAIVSGRYPLKRPLFLLVPKNAKPEVNRFVAFVLSKEGQRYLRKLNVIPLRDIK